MKSSSSRFFLRKLAVSGLTSLLATLGANAAPKYWDTSTAANLQPGSGVWDTGSTALWSDVTSGSNPLVTWADNDDATFQASGTNVVTVNGTILINSLTNTGASTVTTLNGGTLQFNNTGTTITGTNTLTINSNVVLGANQTWGGTTRVNGSISGAFVLSTTNNARLHLNGTNSFGGISITNSSGSAVLATLGGSTTLSGNLNLGSAGARLTSGADNSFTTLGITTSGGYAQLGGNNTFSGAVTASGGLLVIERDANIGSASLFLNGGSLRIVGTQLTTFGGRTVTFGTSSSTTIEIADAANTFVLNKVVNTGSSDSFVKGGEGTLVLNQVNTSAGTYVARGGLLNLDASTGSFNNAAKLGMSGGTFQLTGATGANTAQTMGAVTVNTYGGTIRVDGGSSNSTTLNLGAITATAAGGSLNFQTTGNAPSVTTTTAPDATGIYGGRITYNGADWATSSSGSAPYTLSAYSNYNGGGSFSTSGSNALNSLVTGTSALTGGLTTNTLKVTTTTTGQSLDLAGNVLTLTDGGLLFAGGNNYSITGGSLRSGTATASDLIVHQNGAGTLTISSTITDGNGASTLTKTGSGTLILATNNTYTGQTYINGGTLSGADFSGTSSIFGGATATTGVNINGGTLQYTGVTDATTRTLAIGNNGATIDVAGGSGVVLTWSGTISNTAGAGGLTKTGSGTLLLTTATNSFTGGVTINDGVLQLGNANSLGGTAQSNVVSFGANSTGTLRLNGQSVSIAGLKSNATVGTPVVENASNTAATLTINSAFADTYAGVIRNGTGTGALSIVKDNGNTLTLSGANTYTGSTTVNAGTLLIRNLTGSGTGAGTVLISGSGKLGGTGFIVPTGANGVSFATGSGVDMSAVSGANQLTIDLGSTTGSTTFDAGSTFKFDLASGNLSDVLAFTGLDDASGVSFNLNSLTVTNSQLGLFTLFTFSGGASQADNYTGLLSSTVFGLSIGQTASIIYNADSIQLNVVPEPSTCILLALGAAVCVARRSRRKGFALS